MKEPLELCKEADAYWFHSGDPKEPHAVLTSSKHSDGYVNMRKVLQDPKRCETLTKKLVDKHNILSEKIDYVVSSAYSAITFGYELAKQIGAMNWNRLKSKV